jgi:hypothetical protein
MFCAPGLIFGVTEGIGSRFRKYRVRRFPFSCFVPPDSCSAVPGASGPFFHVLRFRTRFRRYPGHRVPYSCFARLYTFSAVPRASGPVFMFCAPGLIFDGAWGVGSVFHVLRSRTRFRRYQGRRIPFSCFACSYMFSALPRASGPVFMFCAP